MIVSTHGILASSGGSAITNDSGYLFKTTVSSTTITGTTSNTLSYSNLISANTMQVGDFFQFTVNINRVGGIASGTARVYFNTSPSLIGATQIMNYFISPSFPTIFFTEIVPIKTATETDININNAGNVTRDSTSTGVYPSTNIDWTVDQYFIISFQPSNVGDSFFVNGLFFLKT
jgi:hypothetical protein